MPSVCSLCGNGVINDGEECDDENDDQTDSCNQCMLNQKMVTNQETVDKGRTMSRSFNTIASVSNSVIQLP